MNMHCITHCHIPISTWIHLYSRLNTPGILDMILDLVWWNIYCNGGKVMFIKKKKSFLYTSLTYAVDCFPSPAVFVCWLVAYVWRWIQQWRLDLHNSWYRAANGPFTPDILWWRTPFLNAMPKKTLFTGLYINKNWLCTAFTLFPLLL